MTDAFDFVIVGGGSAGAALAARLSEVPGFTVVDPRLRVYGVQNLRVADASVMPEITSGNINAPTIMIGEKAAEIVAADHGLRLNTVTGEFA